MSLDDYMGDGAADSKQSNPKDAIGSSKLPLHLWPETATILGSLGLLDGSLKYGRNNWRVAGVRASIYVDALRRHVAAWLEGEDDDPESGVPHLGHALACLAILVDAQAAGMLNDDRNISGGYRRFVDESTPHVERLKEKHKHRSPRHFTVADNDPAPEPPNDEPPSHALPSIQTFHGLGTSSRYPFHGHVARGRFTT